MFKQQKQSGQRIKSGVLAGLSGLLGLSSLVCWLWLAQPASAVVLTQQGDVNVTATVLPNTPTTPATVDNLVDQSHLQTTPLVVSGTCQAGLTVRVYDNSQLAGTSSCAVDGTFSINITLNAGKNVLTALNFDSFEQAGPASPAVTIFVDLPKPPATVPTTQVANSISEAVGSNPDNLVIQSTQSQRLFEGTFIEPLAKALGLGNNIVVAPGVNHTIAVAANGVFFVSVVALVVVFAI